MGMENREKPFPVKRVVVAGMAVIVGVAVVIGLLASNMASGSEFEFKGKSYGDGEVVITFSEDGKSWKSNWLDFEMEASESQQTLEDVDGQDRKIQRVSDDVFTVNLLGKSRTFYSDYTLEEKEEGKAAEYYLGNSSLKLLLYGDGKFSLPSAEVTGYAFPTKGNGLLMVSKPGDSKEQFYMEDDLVYGGKCDGLLEMKAKEASAISTRGFSLEGFVTDLSGTGFKFGADGKVEINEVAFEYEVDERGLVKIVSQADGLVVDYLKVEPKENGKTPVYRFVFMIDSWSDYLASIGTEVASRSAPYLEANEEIGEGTSQYVKLFSLAALPNVILSEEQKNDFLEELKSRETTETVEIENFHRVVSDSVEFSIPNEELDRRVIEEVGEDNMAPENEDGEAVITMNELAKNKS